MNLLFTDIDDHAADHINDGDGGSEDDDDGEKWFDL